MPHHAKSRRLEIMKNLERSEVTALHCDHNASLYDRQAGLHYDRNGVLSQQSFRVFQGLETDRDHAITSELLWSKGISHIRLKVQAQMYVSSHELIKDRYDRNVSSRLSSITALRYGSLRLEHLGLTLCKLTSIESMIHMRLNHIYVLFAVFATVYSVPTPGNLLFTPSQTKPESNSEQYTLKSDSMDDGSTSFSYKLRSDGKFPVFPNHDQSLKKKQVAFIHVKFIGDHAGEPTTGGHKATIENDRKPAFEQFEKANLESLPIHFENSYKAGVRTRKLLGCFIWWGPATDKSFRIRYWTDVHPIIDPKREYLKVDLGCTSEEPCEGLIDIGAGQFIEHRVVSRGGQGGNEGRKGESQGAKPEKEG
ncbi:hypothetical protein EV360DRAFT_76759 [Lentinula raphanica]|nr:hypothetical protein EV360DRAFT_76759 [Lentinula raphanica]